MLKRKTKGQVRYSRKIKPYGFFGWGWGENFQEKYDVTQQNNIVPWVEEHPNSQPSSSSFAWCCCWEPKKKMVKCQATRELRTIFYYSIGVIIWLCLYFQDLADMQEQLHHEHHHQPCSSMLTLCMAKLLKHNDKAVICQI